LEFRVSGLFLAQAVSRGALFPRLAGVSFAYAAPGVALFDRLAGLCCIVRKFYTFSGPRPPVWDICWGGGHPKCWRTYIFWPLFTSQHTPLLGRRGIRTGKIPNTGHFVGQVGYSRLLNLFIGLKIGAVGGRGGIRSPRIRNPGLDFSRSAAGICSRQ
jgi:hypothetical protein